MDTGEEEADWELGYEYDAAGNWTEITDYDVEEQWTIGYGEWMSEEPLGIDGPNLYHFNFNAPANRFDPSGLESFGGTAVYGDRPLGPRISGPPGFWEGLIPVWGPGRQAVDDFANGRWGWGIFNVAVAVSDFVPVRALADATFKGATRAARGIESRWYLCKGGSNAADATSKWYHRTRNIPGSSPVHHGIIPSNGWGKSVPDWFKNQPWNYRVMPDRSFHSGVHGMGPSEFGLFMRYWNGVPEWARLMPVSIGGRVVGMWDDTDERR